MKNILIIEGQKNISGGQVMTKKIANCINENSDLKIFIPKESTELKKFLSNFNIIEFNLLDFKKGKKFITDYIKFIINIISIPFELKKTIKMNKIDLLYVQSQKMIPYVILSNMFIKRDIIVHLHVYHVDSKARFLLNKCLHNRNVKKIIGVSKYTLSQLDEKNYNKSEVIYNTVDNNNSMIKDFKTIRINKNKINIAVVADLIRDKGQDILLNAISNLNFDMIDVYLVGSKIDNEYVKELEELTSKLTKNKVYFTNRINNVDDLMKEMKLIIIPSKKKFETFSLAMVEAWKNGVPTIASDMGGMRELVNEFCDCYSDFMLFKLGDEIDLARKIENLLSNNILYNELAVKLRDIVNENFNIEIFKEKILKAIENV